MYQRRPQGDGSVYRSERGRGWVAQIELPRDANGRRRRIRRRARTRAEATRLLQGMREEFATTGRLTDRQRLITETVADYLDGRRAAGLSTTSIAREERFSDLITGYFGRVRTADLTVEDLDRFLLDISLGLPDAEGQPTRPLAGRDHLRRLRASLQRAIRNDQRLGLVSTNVANLAELPADTGTSRSTRALSLDELGRLLDEADGAIGVLVDLIGRHGLRPAEARAMTWTNVDLRRGVLWVTAQIGAANTSAPPKTTRATRTIRLHRASAGRLHAWRPLQADERKAARQAWTELDLVATTGMGTPVDRTTSTAPSAGCALTPRSSRR